RPTRSTLLPYPTLFRSLATGHAVGERRAHRADTGVEELERVQPVHDRQHDGEESIDGRSKDIEQHDHAAEHRVEEAQRQTSAGRDRKSTRLNSSHVSIS